MPPKRGRRLWPCHRPYRRWSLQLLGVFGYLYYDHVTQKPVVKIDVPGFSGEIAKDKGVDIDVGKP
jgi:hypothetical protein